MNEPLPNLEERAFDLAAVPSMEAEDFFVSDCNRAAFRLISDPGSWPNGKLAIVGEACSGKTHLANIWRRRSGAEIIEAKELDSADIRRLVKSKGVAVESADSVSGFDALEEALLGLHNYLAETGGNLLMTSRAMPSRWAISLPDLRSRMAASHVAVLSKPDDQHLEALLIKHFSDRQISISRSTTSYILARIERSCYAVQGVAAALDSLSLAKGRPVTRGIASELLAEARLSGLAR